MAFRNPLTSLPASGITGLVQSDQIADELVGKTITGSLIRTAAAGKRWEISAAVTNLINAFTGHAAETAPGVLQVDASASGQGSVTLKASSTAAGSGAGLVITGPDPDSGNAWAGADLAGDYGHVGVAGASGIDWTPQGPLGGPATFLHGGVYLDSGLLLADSGWVNATLAAGWTVFGGETPGYRCLNGITYLRGRAVSTGAGATAFTLPAGFRPSPLIVLLAENNGAAVRCQVSAAGAVGQTVAAAAIALSFGSFRPFPADQ